MKQIVEKYINNLTAHNYSERTIEVYVCYLEKFLRAMDKNPYHITTKEIEEYIVQHKFSSVSQQNQVIGSVKLFAKYILGKKELHLKKIERPRKEKKLPLVIAGEKLKSTILAIKNLKHKAILMLGYSCALRVSEVINLKIEDIDSDRMLVYIRNAKGRKDRVVVLSPALLDTLRAYFIEYRPTTYLFNGQFGPRYSSTSCNKLVKKYLGVRYRFHTLRHSGATTMLENGTDISLIQKILGHTKVTTTMIYTHVSEAMLRNVKSPI